jgi:UDP-N-acetylglucosamine diphosphorylase/glucosamine-1-phosphate N-acetyltransferase
MAANPRMIIFDDGRGDLSPMTDLRACFEIRTGISTSAERIIRARREQLAGYWTENRLGALVAERSPVSVNMLPEDESILLVNGRWLSPRPELSPAKNSAIVDESSGDVIIASCGRNQAREFLDTAALPIAIAKTPVAGEALLYHPWEVITHRDRVLEQDFKSIRILEALVPDQSLAILGTNPVEIHRSARVYPGVVLDAEHGPVMVEEAAVVRPNAVLCGPCYVGKGSTIAEHALIKAHTVIGPSCKIGGEVGGTIFQGFSNKVHDGHLGDSWVGEWVNFGAGTTNSNLLNTYGEVVMKARPDGPRERTGLTFLGAIVGDHVKFAIKTRIMTGSAFGTGAMIATTAPPLTTVPAFAWMTDEGTRLYRMDKFLDVARTAMGRRGIAMSAGYEQAIRALVGKGGAP